MHRVLFASTLILLLAAPALRAEPSSALADDVGRFLTERNPVVRLARGIAITKQGVGAREVADAVTASRRWDADAPKGDVVTWTATTSDQVDHTVFAYAPPTYTAEKAWPLLVWMHGGVNREEGGGGEGGVERLRAEADAKGFLILSPSTQRGSEWWGPRGVKLLRDTLDEMKLRYRVDADRVCAAGFSDGGSACLHLLAHDPGPYCCFLSFVGHPLSSRIYGGPTWEPNVASRPVYAVNGGTDRLFPAAQVRPFFFALRDAGLDLTWHDEPELGHEWPLLEKRWEEAYEFWKAHPRDAAPKTVSWTTSRPRGEGRFAWVEVLATDEDAQHAEGMERAAEMLVPDMRRPRLGIRLTRDFEGPGLVIETVEEGTPAAAAGLKDGDVILRAGEVAFASGEDLPKLPAYLRALGGAEGVFLVKRGDEELEVRARPEILEKDKPARPAALGYDLAPASIQAEVKDGNVIDVRTFGVRSFRLHLSDLLVDRSKDVQVRLNGAEAPVFEGKLADDAAYVLAQAVGEGPGVPVSIGAVTVDVP